jgi:hypothetical protein
VRLDGIERAPAAHGAVEERSLDCVPRLRPGDTAGTHNSRSAKEEKMRGTSLGVVAIGCDGQGDHESRC